MRPPNEKPEHGARTERKRGGGEREQRIRSVFTAYSQRSLAAFSRQRYLAALIDWTDLHGHLRLLEALVLGVEGPRGGHEALLAALGVEACHPVQGLEPLRHTLPRRVQRDPRKLLVL